MVLECVTDINYKVLPRHLHYHNNVRTGQTNANTTKDQWQFLETEP